MKKLLPLLLALLLLVGCGVQEVTPTTNATEPTTKPAQPGLYDDASAVEQQTDGAVRLYRLEKNDYFAISSIGSRLLLRAQDGTMQMLQGDTCIPGASISTGTDLMENKMCFDTSVQGAAYYDPDTRQVVLVNPQLQETDRIDLPEDMLDIPYIHMAGEEVFYCVPGQVRAVNFHTGISRLIHSHSYTDQHLGGMWFDGQLLLLCLNDADELLLEYISTETGRTVYEAAAPLENFATCEERYVLSRLDGGVFQTLVGSRQTTAQLLNISQSNIASALAQDGVIGYTDEGDLQLAFYNITNGKCTAQVTLPGIHSPESFHATEDAIWFLAQEGEEQVLCSWDITRSSVTDATVYTSKLYTADDPDKEGLAVCAERALQLSDTYGVKIHLLEQVVHNQLSEDAWVAEHQVEAVNRMLDELTVALERFPENFLRKTVKNGWIHINLVRTLGSDEPVDQFWQDGDCYITISGQTNVEESFYRGVAYAIDSRVLGNSRKFDDWGLLNPEGFSYSYSYEPRQDLDTYLNVEGSAFLSEKAMAHPHDDRSEVFCNAMIPAGETTLASEVMQAKLLCMCRAIREAYDLEKSEETYPWEQHLAESLAYTD